MRALGMHTGYADDQSRPNGGRPREKGIDLDRGLAFSLGIIGGCWGNADSHYMRGGIPFQPSKRAQNVEGSAPLLPFPGELMRLLAQSRMPETSKV